MFLWEKKNLSSIIRSKIQKFLIEFPKICKSSIRELKSNKNTLESNLVSVLWSIEGGE